MGSTANVMTHQQDFGTISTEQAAPFADVRLPELLILH